MPEVQSTDQLIAAMAGGPVGVGEDHTEGYARDFIANLILNGQVNQLFIEYPQIYQARVDDLQTALTRNRVDHGEVKRCQTNFSSFLRADFRGNGHPHPLVRLVTQALVSGVVVWASDSALPEPTRMRQRHTNVRQVFYAKTNQAGNPQGGTVLLFGSHHFTDLHEGLDRYIANLQYFNY